MRRAARGELAATIAAHTWWRPASVMVDLCLCAGAARWRLRAFFALSFANGVKRVRRERKPAGMHCTTYQRYTNTIGWSGWLGRSKRNHREVTYGIVQDVGTVSVAVLDDEDGESKSVRLDAAVERVVARVDAASQ